jgi:hypothetical protein
MVEVWILDVIFLFLAFLIGSQFSRGKGNTAISNFMILALFFWGLMFNHRMDPNPKLVYIPIAGASVTFLAVLTAISVERGKHKKLEEYRSLKYKILTFIGRNVMAIMIQIIAVIYINT